MCAPAAAPILAATSAVVGATGAIVQGRDRAAAQYYSAKVAERNAQLENEAARDSLEQTRMEAVRLYRRGSQTEGQQIAAMAANGVDVGWGSAAQAQEDTRMLLSEDIANLYDRGLQEVRGRDIAASNQRANAIASRRAAKASMTAAYFDAATTILGGAEQVSGYRAK